MGTKALLEARPIHGLLATKFEVPFGGRTVVQRGRLIQMIEASKDWRICLVLAPTGYGKTTLLAEWITSQPGADWRAVWITLDSYDDDPQHFWAYISAGILRAYPQIRGIPDVLLQGNFDPRDLTSLNCFINQIGQAPYPLLLILDNYESITHPDIHQSLKYLIEHQPRKMRLVLSSRTAPPIPLSRLRAQQQVLEISAGDLAFNYQETRTFLRSFIGVTLAQDKVVDLLESTEGWIAGLQFAALSSQDQPNLSRPIADLQSGSRQILEYLTEEVLNRQSEEVKEFLLKTSILPELSAPLCDAVLDRSDSHVYLQEIERANLFVISLDSQRGRYRYHRMFSDTLQAHLKREYPDQIVFLHRKACAWLRENGQEDKAVFQALAAGDLDTAAEIMDACALQAIIEFDLDSLVNWINRFSNDLIAHRPRLGIYYAVASFQLGNMEQIEGKLKLVEDALPDSSAVLPHREDEDLARWELSTVRTVLESLRQEYPIGLQRIRALEKHCPPEDIYFKGFLAHCLAENCDAAGDYEEAARAYIEGIRCAVDHNLQVGYLHSRCGLARVRKQQGQFREAEHEYQEALDYALEAGLGIGTTFMARMGLAELALGRNDLEAAAQWVRGVVDNYDTLMASTLVWVYRALTTIQIARYFLCVDDIPTSRLYYENAIRMLENHTQPTSFLPTTLIDLQVQFWMATGEPCKFDSLVDGDHRGKGIRGEAELAYQVAEARISLQRQEPEMALPILAHAREAAARCGYGERLLECLVLQAITYKAVGQIDKAILSLDEALRLAAPEGWNQVFLQEGKPMRSLLGDYLGHSRESRYGFSFSPQEVYFANQVKDLLDRRSPLSQASDGNGSPVLMTTRIEPVNEPLSPRERDVLEMLRLGRSTKQIALDLGISINTVKAHIKSIYRKVGSHSRKVVFQNMPELILTEASDGR